MKQIARESHADLPGNRPSRDAPLWVLAIAILAVLTAIALWRTAAPSSHVIFDGESEFGRIRVVERADGLRSLYTGEGRARQSAVYPDRPRHLESEYARVAMVGLALAPANGRILFVGLGGGAMPTYTRQVLPEARLEVVEIDPAIVNVAQRYFRFRPDSLLGIHTGDGRAFIEDAEPGSYDLIVLDAFSDDQIPEALTTRQFLEAVRDALSPDGVVVSNLWSSQRQYRAMVATYDAVFAEVELIRVGRGVQRILVASADRPLARQALIEASRSLANRAELGFDLSALVEGGHQTRSVPARR